MINLQTFFKIHFDTKEISDDNLYKFSEDHIARLHANNDKGVYSVMIATTEAAFEVYATAMSQEDAQYTQQQGSTLKVAAVIAEFKEQVSRSEGLINYTYGIKSSAYQEFFPSGVTEYSKAKKANIETLMARIIVKAQKYQDTLGEVFTNKFITYRHNYIQARRTQLQNIGRVSADKSRMEEVRSSLERQLMLNVLQLAIEFLGNAERGLDFFDQSIIRRNIYKIDEGEIISNTIDANSSKTVLSNFDSNSSFVLSNVGNTTLRFCVSDNEDEACTQNGITISAGDTITATSLELNPNGGDKLNVTNLDTINAGKYIVERLA